MYKQAPEKKKKKKNLFPIDDGDGNKHKNKFLLSTIFK
jgi:hypothetical protein